MRMSSDGLHSELTHKIIGAAFEVHRNLGHGFLENVYVAALLHELAAAQLTALAEAPIAVTYKGLLIGRYFADILVEGLVICEIKAVQRLLPEHEAQLLHYLRATDIEVGLLLNFGARSMQVKRLVFTPPETTKEESV
jgi:GxxExxY protein